MPPPRPPRRIQIDPQEVERIKARVTQVAVKGLGRLFEAVMDSALEQADELLQGVQKKTDEVLEEAQSSVNRTRKRVRRPRPPR